MLSLSQQIVLWGLLLGWVLGYVGRTSNYCTMGAISDVMLMGDTRRMRMWLLAMAVALGGTQVLINLGLLNPTQTLYSSQNLYWLATAIGGVMFGVGMVLSSGCGYKSLVRAGTGNLKSMTVLLVMAVSALAMMKGLPAVFRVGSMQAPAVTLSSKEMQLLPLILSADAPPAWPAVLLCALLLFVVFIGPKFRRDWKSIGAGFIVGALVVAGWYVTGHLAYAEDPNTLEMTYLSTNSHLAESISFVSPLGYLLEWFVYGSDTSRVLTFGMTVTLGVFLGSLSHALFHRQFRLESFTTRPDFLRHILGAVLMGTGGIMCLGCTMGEGLSGISLLSINAFIAIFAIVAGAIATLQYELKR